MKTKKTTLIDGAKVSYFPGQVKEGRVIQNGRRSARVTFRDGVNIYVSATFASLLDAKVKVAIKEHYSKVIAALAKTAREINANAGKRKRNVLGAMDFTRI